jgi:hypothetical protein
MHDRMFRQRGTTYVWDPLDYEDHRGLDPRAAAKAAQADRAQWVKQWRKTDTDPTLELHVWRLTGQLRPYASFGNPDGRTRTVYYADIRHV